MRSQTALWPSLMPVTGHGDDALCTVSAKGVRVRFADGRELLCGTSGLWNVNLGYGNEEVARRCAEALRDASYLNIFRYENSWARHAADRLIAAAGPDRWARVTYSTSGGAANDLAMKLARLRAMLVGKTKRRVIVGLRHSYHGLTYGAFGLTGEDLAQRLYSVDRRFVDHITANSVEELDSLMDRIGDTVAAIVVEPVLGSGTTVLSEEFLEAIFAHRRREGFLLVADEVATGFGRTGPMFASTDWSESPDVMLVSKGLTNGACASAAVLMSAEVAQTLTNNQAMLMHAETQAGTPLACAAIDATLDEFARLDAIEAGRTAAAQLDTELQALAQRLPVQAQVTGQGMFRTLQIMDERGQLVDGVSVVHMLAAIRDAGAVLHNGLGGPMFVPALTYRPEDLAELVECAEAGITNFLAGEQR